MSFFTLRPHQTRHAVPPKALVTPLVQGTHGEQPPCREVGPAGELREFPKAADMSGSLGILANDARIVNLGSRRPTRAIRARD